MTKKKDGTNTGNKHISIRIDDALMIRLKQASEALKTPKTTLVRQFVIEKLDEIEQRNTQI